MEVREAQLFERVGRLYIELVSVMEQKVVVEAQFAEASRAAGEALRALEALGRKDIADAILKKGRWSVQEVAAQGTQERPPQSGTVAIES